MDFSIQTQQEKPKQDEYAAQIWQALTFYSTAFLPVVVLRMEALDAERSLRKGDSLALNFSSVSLCAIVKAGSSGSVFWAIGEAALAGTALIAYLLSSTGDNISFDVVSIALPVSLMRLS